MNRVNISIFFGTLYSLFYAVAVATPSMEVIGDVMFVFAPVMFLIVTFCILTDKKEPQKTFEEYFYQDEEIRRNIP